MDSESIKKIPTQDAMPMVILFENAPDRNVQLMWLGELPRVGEYFIMRGRDEHWRVVRLEWHCSHEKKTKTFERAVKVLVSQQDIEGDKETLR